MAKIARPKETRAPNASHPPKKHKAVRDAAVKPTQRRPAVAAHVTHSQVHAERRPDKPKPRGDGLSVISLDTMLDEPPIEVFESVPSFPSDFAELRRPKSPLAKEIAAKAMSAEEFVRQMANQKRSSAQTFRINPYSLDIVPGFNVHSFDDEATASYIWGLSESIEQKGVLRALMVHWAGGKIFVDAGEHRLRATFVAIELRGAHIEGVPIIFAPRGQSDVDRLYQQRLDNTIRRLTVLEEGILVKRIIAKSALNEEDAIREIARNYGTSVAIIQSYLETAALPEEVQTLIRHGRIRATFARQIFRDTGRDPDRTMAIIEEAKARAGVEDERKIMPKHVPEEQLAQARAASGNPKRNRTSSKLKYQPKTVEPPVEAEQTQETERPVEAEQTQETERPVEQAAEAEPAVQEAVEPSAALAETARQLYLLLETAEPSVLRDGRAVFAFADQNQFAQACHLLGKSSVLSEEDDDATEAAQSGEPTTEPADSAAAQEPDAVPNRKKHQPVSADA